MRRTIRAGATSSARMRQAEVHSHNLDLLRSVAVLCVLVSHIAGTLGHREFGSLGRFGVVLFFFHTSFVLMQSLQRMNKSASGWRLTAGFWIRRAFRIYPLAMLIVLVTVAARVPENGVGRYVPTGTKALLSNLALTQNLIYAEPVLGPLWSLPLEVQMYLLLPAAYLLVKRYKVKAPWMWLGSVVLAIVLPHVNDRFGVFFVGPCFASGILAFQWKTRVKERLPAWLWPIALAAAAALFGPVDNVSLGAKIARAWMVSLLVAVAYLFTREAGRSVVSRVAHFVAEISYGVYLSHILLIYAVSRYLRPGVGADLAFLLTLPLVSWLLFQVVERPFIAVGRLLSMRVMGLGGHAVPGTSANMAPQEAPLRIDQAA